MDGNSDHITDDFIKRIELERIEINAAYDTGNGIDSVDNIANDISLAAKTDRYGFIHDTNLPAQLTDVEKMRNSQENIRATKWLKMMDNWSEHILPKPNDTLKRRVLKGIPDKIRNLAWYKLLDIDSQKKLQSGVYEKMKKSGRLYSLDLRQIDLDINRTFRDNTAYRKRYCPRQVQLYNVLAAYSIYNTEIGYCQGMSGITALLLMYLSDEESTFWALSELMSNPKYSMHGMFKKGFPKLLRYSEKHEKIIEQLLPKVHKNWKKCNISAMLYTTKWFLQCYLDALPFSLVLRIWDVYLLKGDSVLIAMSYCILKVHAKRLKNLDMDSINDFLKNQLPKDFGLSDDDAIKQLQECVEELKRYRLDVNIKQIPSNELPTTPFGHVDKITRERIINNQKKLSLDEIVEKLKTQQTQLNTSTNKNRSNNNNNNSNNGDNTARRSSTLSLNSDDSLGEYEDENDDLNPSKLSDYDKESILSDLTNSNQSSQNNDENINNNLKRSPSDYDNISEKNNYLLKNKNNTNPLATPSSNRIKTSLIETNNYQSLPSKIKTTVLIRNQTPISSNGTISNINNNNKSNKIEERKYNSSDIYERNLEIQLDKEENNLNRRSSNKNITRIVYHKDNNEFIRHQYGIYAREKSVSLIHTNNNDNINQTRSLTPNILTSHQSPIKFNNYSNNNNNNNSPNKTLTTIENNKQNVKIMTKIPINTNNTNSNGYDYI